MISRKEPDLLKCIKTPLKGKDLTVLKPSQSFERNGSLVLILLLAPM